MAIRLVRRPGDLLNRPDAILIPGTKNTLADLHWLRESGLADAILRHAGKAELLGICGGYQMLGRSLHDPQHVESDRGDVPGLGLLPMTTTMASGKALRQVTGRHRQSGLDLRGYEIHHGQTVAENLDATVELDMGEAIGYGDGARRIWGTYLHGLFDADAYRRWWIDRLREAKGLPPLNAIQATYDVDAALDRLADHVRANIDLPTICQFMGLP